MHDPLVMLLFQQPAFLAARILAIRVAREGVAIGGSIESGEGSADKKNRPRVYLTGRDWPG